MHYSITPDGRINSMKKRRTKFIGKRVIMAVSGEEYPWEVVIKDCYEELDCIFFSVQFEDGLQVQIEKDSVIYFEVRGDALIEKKSFRKRKFKKGHLELIK